MSQTQLPLQKRTKAEILEEYQKLLENYEELKMTAKLVSEPQNVELLARAKDYAADNLNKSIVELKDGLNRALGDLSDKLLAEAQKLGEITRAVELSRKNLELQYNIQVAAETLDNLLAENKRQKFALEEEIANKNRDWARQQEEYDYNIKLRQRREDELYQERTAKKEKEFEQRVQNLAQQEQELQNLRKESIEFPKRLENALAQKEQEVTKRLNAQFAEKLEQEKKDWQAQKNIQEIQIDNLETRIKELNSEVSRLKQEAERANSKAQELAVKVIESGSVIASKTESGKVQPAT